MLRATGLDDAAIAKPLVAVVHTWSDVSPCNINLRELAEHVGVGIKRGGGTPIEFNTIAVTDGIAMGSDGMRASAKGRIIAVDIDPSLLQPSEKQMLEDLIAAALNDARGKADAASSEAMAKMTSGLPLPPGFKLPF